MELLNCLWIIGGLFLAAILFVFCSIFVRSNRKVCILIAHILINIALIIWGEGCGRFCFMLLILYVIAITIAITVVKNIRTKNGYRWGIIIHITLSILLMIKAYPFVVLTIFMLFVEFGIV